MKILIVDGNEKEASDRYIKIGMDTQYNVYSKVLKKLAKDNLEIVIIHPAISKDFIPKGFNLDNFDGVVWTGSLLNIYDQTSSILRQIEFAKYLLDNNNNIFGSCWGLQVLVTAAGGKVKKNPNGLEAVIAKNINLNQEGINHPMYTGKQSSFDSFCWHYDEVETLPDNVIILASNNISKIQSIYFENKKCNVWAVQYHPEFNSVWMSGLISQREKVLLDEGVYKNMEELNKFKNFLSKTKKYNKLKKSLSISNSLIDEKIHTLEIANWLKFIKN